MHGTHCQKIAKIELGAIAVYLFKTDPTAMKGAISLLSRATSQARSEAYRVRSARSAG